MADRDSRERRRPVDAGRRVTEHSSGDRQSLNIPPGLGMWSPKKAGAYRIEIIPFEVGVVADKFTLRKYADVGDLYYERTYWNHRGIGVNNDSYVCGAKTFGKPCPICEHRSQLAQSPRAENEEMVKALAPKERQLFLIVDHDDEAKGVQLWEISYALFGKQLDAKIANADEEDRVRFRRFADPDEGSTLKLAASEEAIQRTKYLEFAVDEIRPRKVALDPDWVEHNFCLDDMVRLVPYEELKKIFLQTGDDDRDARQPARGTGTRTKPRDEDPEPAPRSRRQADPDPEPAKPATRPAARPAPAESANGDGNVPTFRKGEVVEFKYREAWHGLDGDCTVKDHDTIKGIVQINVPGRERAHVVDDIDVRYPAEPAKPARRAAPAEDPEPAPRTRRAAPADDADPPPAKSRRAAQPADDNEDPPARPARGRQAATAEDPEPAPRKSRQADPEPDEPAPRRAAPAPRKSADTEWD